MPVKTISISAQQRYWNVTNTLLRETSQGLASHAQAEVIRAWFERLGQKNLSIIDVGCGTGWFSEQLTRFGKVTGTDLSDEVLARASIRVPEIRFFAGDFFQLDLGKAEFDAAVSLEVLTHVADQALFLDTVATLLKPGGYLMIATQNKPALERNDIPPPGPGQLRRWVDRKELQKLLEDNFEIEELFSIGPEFNRGFLRYVNSGKLRQLATTMGFGGLMAQIEKWQEDAWLGWSLVALARKRAA